LLNRHYIRKNIYNREKEKERRGLILISVDVRFKDEQQYKPKVLIKQKEK
jgi:hypothetical protein